MIDEFERTLPVRKELGWQDDNHRFCERCHYDAGYENVQTFVGEECGSCFYGKFRCAHCAMSKPEIFRFGDTEFCTRCEVYFCSQLAYGFGMSDTLAMLSETHHSKLTVQRAFCAYCADSGINSPLMSADGGISFACLLHEWANFAPTCYNCLGVGVYPRDMSLVIPFLNTVSISDTNNLMSIDRSVLQDLVVCGCHRGTIGNYPHDRWSRTNPLEYLEQPVTFKEWLSKGNLPFQVKYGQYFYNGVSTEFSHWTFYTRAFSSDLRTAIEPTLTLEKLMKAEDISIPMYLSR